MTIPDFSTPKLKVLTDTLDKRCDDLRASLGAAIGEIEANALNPRLSSWLDWVAEGRRSAAVVVGIGGNGIAKDFAELCGADASVPDAQAIVVAGAAPLLNGAIRIPAGFSPDLGLIGVLDASKVQNDALLLGELQRESVGFVWLDDRASLPPELNDVFRESIFGVYSRSAQADGSTKPEAPALGAWYSLPPDLGTTPREILARLLPKPARQPVAVLATARHLIALAGVVQSEYARENARLTLQASVAERIRNSRTFLDELTARKDLMTEMREDLNRDLQLRLDEITKLISELDGETLFRGSVRRAFDSIPGLRVESGKLIYFRHFEVESKSSWFTGTSWQRFDSLFPRKMEISLPAEQVNQLCADLVHQLVGVTSKEAKRRIERFNRSIDEFAENASSAGVDVKSAEVETDESNRWERRPPPGRQKSALQERTHRVLDTTCQKDVKGFTVDIERKGPIGRVMEARTAVMGASFLILTGIRVTNAVHNAHLSGGSQTTTQGPMLYNLLGLLFNATIVAVFFIFVGLIVNSITKEGKEAAVITEKVKSARDGLEDKLVGVMGRFLNDELGIVKSTLAEHKAAALDRFDRAIDATKQEIDEQERRARSGGTRLGSRPGLPPLPMGLKTDVDKVTAAARDVRAELAGRYAPAPAPPIAAATRTPAAASAAKPAAKPAEPPNPALTALAARIAARQAAAAAKETSS